MVLKESRSTELGMPAPDFSLTGTDGMVHTRSSCCGPNGMLVMFICSHCPFVLALRDRLVDDMRELHALGIGVVAINPNEADPSRTESLAQMRQQGESWGFCFPYLRDDAQAVARAYGAVCTPEFFGFDRGLALAYRGRLDAATPALLHLPRRRELVEAMGEIAETGRCSRPPEPAVGCSIKWRKLDA
jgi:peroxiredoxin